jgi:DNA-directed RNA polymerase subunit RPC12/RpoP
MVKCGVCGADVDKAPKITEKGTCSACGAKLTVKK